MILTSTEYIAYRKRTRPAGVTLAEFNECYPAAALIDAWRKSLWSTFQDAQRNGLMVRPAVLRSMERHMGACEAYKAAAQMAKHFPGAFPADWFTYMAVWKRAQEQTT